MFSRRENIERSEALEARIATLRAVQYPTEAQMEELEDARVVVAEINDWLNRIQDQ